MKKNKNTKRQHISDKYKGKSFSEVAEAISKKYPLKDTDMIQKKSFALEMDNLIRLQEQVREEESANSEFEYGGAIPKYFNGSTILPLEALKQLGTTAAQQQAFATAQGQRIAAGQIGSNVDYQNSLGQVSIPQTLPALNSRVASQTIPANPFVSKTSLMQTDDNSGIQDRNMFGDNPLVIDNNSGMSKPEDAPKTGSESSAYLPAYIGQGLSTLLNLGILAGGPDKEAPIDNPYEQEVKRLSNQSIDTTQQRNQILGSYNAALQNLGNVRSANVRNALQANLARGTADSLAQSKLAEQQANIGLRQNYANVLNQLGMQKSQAQQVAQEINARNKGQFLSNVSALGANVAQSGEFLTNKKLNDNQNKLLADILSSKYQNVGINPDLWVRMKQGKPTSADISILKSTYGEEAANSIIKSFNADE